MIKDSIKQLKSLCESYKATIDTLAKNYLEEKDEHLRKIEEMRKLGAYKDEYLAEAEKDFKPTRFDYVGDIRKAQSAVLNSYKNITDDIRKELDDFINSPIDEDFATKVSIMINSGISLSDYEMQTLERQAQTYFEKRLFSQLASMRKDEKGNPKPYIFVGAPDMDKIGKGFEELIASGHSLFRFYCGSCELPKKNWADTDYKRFAVLYDIMQPRRENSNTLVPIHLCSNADNIVVKDKCGEFLKMLDDIGGMN